MKKLLFIVFILFSISVSSQEGYWLCKDFRIVERENGWGPNFVGIMIDFSNSKVMALVKDTIIPVSIDKLNKVISYEKDPRVLNYKKVNNTIEIKDGVIINVFYPFKFKKELCFSKNKVLKKLISNKIKNPRDSLTIKFLNKKSDYNPYARVLSTQFLSQKEYKTVYWFLEEINKNLFLSFSSEYNPMLIESYRITGVNKKRIDLETIIEQKTITTFKKIEFVD